MSRVRQDQMSWTSIAKSDADGIEKFKFIDSLSINHRFSLKQALTSIPMRPKYGIFNNQGEQLFYAFEESDPFGQVCCTNERKFTMHVVDNQSRELIRVHRELQSCSGCCCFANCENCKQHVTVESPPGHILGTVEQEFSLSSMKYVLKDANDTPMLFIMGPCCICDGTHSCGCENKYALLGTDRITEIGSIDKQYFNSVRVSTANPVAFTLNFPLNLDARMKIVALAALFLIDIGNYNMARLRS
ncbi:unnamed protein product [Rotaria magnacalcarata]|uniref:Phospholipid scramblase n=4 Tax=Rotaria magnacalcarata TaxID=392030 RepID=A0A815XQL6_9BILA|nr:unnamed protein product [Rotaria magnacalcarata]CAF2034650.1 unnamed protein product [Rotaria magnacalcarata]CAF2047312.1 unnamed protein product [Rotaria magnacalcarata]CAF2161929.1 unnamed protein product [Rotaria magnacalcarata]CAF3838969.1 unnamed protein product [Rotaria magnacalcarata]